jgi:hypothetical protein
MLRDAAVAMIKQGLGFRSDLDSEIVTEMRFQQEEILEQGATLPWFLLSAVSSLATGGTPETVALPSDFLLEYEEAALWFLDTTQTADEQWIKLSKTFIDETKTSAIATWSDADVKPTYSIVNKLIYLAPIPDDVYDLRIIYFAQDTQLSSNVTNLWLTHAADLLIARTGLAIAEDIGNDPAVLKYEKRLQRADARLGAENEARQHTQMRYVMGGMD